MRKVIVGLWALGLLAMPVMAQDEEILLMVNPSGQPASPTDEYVSYPDPIDPGAVICGDLNYDRVNGLAAQRRPDIGLESWVLMNCDIAVKTEIQGFRWVTVDNTNNDWTGVDDFAIWNAATVENGCADDTNTIAAGRDLPNTREGPIDFLFNRNAWRYTLVLPQQNRVILQPGKYYFAVRAVLRSGQSFILTVPCNGRKPVYFQSVFFNFPCAVPGRNVFGTDYCAAIEVIGKPVGGGCPNDGCGTFDKLLCKGPPKHKVVAKGSGIVGKDVRVVINGNEHCARVNDRGKWKVVLKNSPGAHTAVACGATKTCTH